MDNHKKKIRCSFIPLFIGLLITAAYLPAAGSSKALVLQEMCWPDVQEYLKTNDMVIIPIGSTEQHGPHLPLGTDFFAAFDTSKMISEKTGVVVAPVILSGYSVYHSGFPGTLSLKPETLEAVLFDTAEMLIKSGFKRIMFFNYHGGNRVIESSVLHKINHTTKATAISIAIGSNLLGDYEEPAPFDHHAGVGETSIMLYLEPGLVHMDRAQKAVLTFSPKLQELQKLTEKEPELAAVVDTYLGVPEETGKGGASHQLSSNGVWSLGDPQDATKELGDKIVQLSVDRIVKFIEAWKQAKK